MIKSFWVMTLLLGIFVIAVAAHYMSMDRDEIQEAVTSVSALVQFVEPAQGVSWYASRQLQLGEQGGTNPIYPEMQSMQRMEFVYGK